MRHKISTAIILSELLCQQDLSVLSLSRRHESCLERIRINSVSELSNVGSLAEMNIGDILNESDGFAGHFLAC